MPEKSGPGSTRGGGTSRILRTDAIPEGILAALEAAGVELIFDTIFL